MMKTLALFRKLQSRNQEKFCILVTGIGLTIGFFGAIQAVAQDSVSIQKCMVTKFTGTVQVWSKEQSAWLKVQEGMQCRSGHTIQTMPGSQIFFTIEPAMSAFLEENTTVTFDKMLINYTKKNIRMLIKQQKGVFSIITEPLFGHTALMTLTTPSAIIDMNGAQAVIRVLGNSTVFELAAGAAKVRPVGSKMKYLLNAGTQTVIYANKQEIAISQLPVKYESSRPDSTRKQPKIAILSVQSSAITKENLERVSDYIAEEFEKKSNGKVLFLEDIRSMLQAEGVENLLTCFADSCISQIGNAIGADIVIIGGIGQLGNNYLFSLKMIDVLRDNVLSRVSTRVTGDIGKVLDEIPVAVGNLVRKNSVQMDSIISAPRAAKNGDSAGYRETVTWIKAGPFIMGSKSLDGELDETPPHQVDVNGFYIDKYEVAKEDYEKVMGNNPSSTKGCKICPVDNVTWFEAQEYCKKIGKRLPTEAEWEYACRAGTATTFAFGNAISGEQANFNGKEPFGGVPAGPYKGKTVPVGSYAPNAWRLYDMHGNVAEWCSDWYDAAYYGNSVKANPTGPKDGKLKVVRGGAWNSIGSGLRCAKRAGYNPTMRLNSIGFRCVKDDADSLKSQQKSH
jgi:formylglycine-generating enzyme required for sulfatase activity